MLKNLILFDISVFFYLSEKHADKGKNCQCSLLKEQQRATCYAGIKGYEDDESEEKGYRFLTWKYKSGKKQGHSYQSVIYTLILEKRTDRRACKLVFRHIEHLCRAF